jgi:hypothetical protein
MLVDLPAGTRLFRGRTDGAAMSQSAIGTCKPIGNVAQWGHVYPGSVDSFTSTWSMPNTSGLPVCALDATAIPVLR